jgi:hypothetical protein
MGKAKSEASQSGVREAAVSRLAALVTILTRLTKECVHLPIDRAISGNLSRRSNCTSPATIIRALAGEVCY